jgi:hypothetical protein
MGKRRRQITTSLLFTGIYFVVMGIIRLFSGSEYWLFETLGYAISSGIGWFAGYGFCEQDKK